MGRQMICALLKPRNPIVREWVAQPRKAGKHKISKRKQRRQEKRDDYL